MTDFKNESELAPLCEAMLARVYHDAQFGSATEHNDLVAIGTCFGYQRSSIGHAINHLIESDQIVQISRKPRTYELQHQMPEKMKIKVGAGDKVLAMNIDRRAAEFLGVAIQLAAATNDDNLSSMMEAVADLKAIMNRWDQDDYQAFRDWQHSFYPTVNKVFEFGWKPYKPSGNSVIDKLKEIFGDQMMVLQMPGMPPKVYEEVSGFEGDPNCEHCIHWDMGSPGTKCCLCGRVKE